MKSFTFLYIGILLSIHIEYVFSLCPILGPDFVPPTRLANSTSIQNATLNLQNSIVSSISAGGLLESLSSTVSFSAEIFSTHSIQSLYTFHHSAANLNASDGTKTINSHSIYRVGSVSKLFTVYLFLIESGDIHFNTPITSFVPELAVLSKSQAKEDPLDFVDWENISIGELASQQAGIGRDYLADYAAVLTPANETAAGLPLLNGTSFPPCSLTLNCTRAEFFQMFYQKHPVYAPSTTPIYSNAAFQILSYALENITGRSFPDMLQTDMIDKLHLLDTSYSKPKNDSRGVITSSDRSPVTSYWDNDLADITPAGGIYSSSADLVTLGKAILSSKLLSPTQTRRWMKPLSHTSSLNFSVGAPWEILRLQLLEPPRIVDLYTKDGDWGDYHSVIVVIPDWDIGFTVLEAGGDGTIRTIMADIIAEIFLPAVETAARTESTQNFVGTYSDSALNSSVIVTSDPSLPGLGVSSWFSEGKDVFFDLNTNIRLSIRLYPTGLKKPGLNGTTVLGYRAVFENGEANYTAPTGLFDAGCGTWFNVDSMSYGSLGFDDFVFTVDAHGQAQSISPRFLRATLPRNE